MNVKIELYYRYADDQNIAGWSIGRTMKFCQVDGKFKNKTDGEINDDIDKREDELFMKELSKIADTTMEMLFTEADSPGQHPELGYKVPILDVAVWVEEMSLPPPGMEDLNLHTKCTEGKCSTHLVALPSSLHPVVLPPAHVLPSLHYPLLPQ